MASVRRQFVCGQQNFFGGTQLTRRMGGEGEITNRNGGGGRKAN